jgi:hypothetical protein
MRPGRQDLVDLTVAHADDRIEASPEHDHEQIDNVDVRRTSTATTNTGRRRANRGRRRIRCTGGP